MLDVYPGLDTWQRAVPCSPRRGTALGIGALLAGVLAFGCWAVLAPLNGAVVASGSFVATGQNKQVQHLEGGIVRDLLVREGDIVEAASTVVRLDDTPALANLKRLQLRKHRALAMQARLEAQIEGRPEMAMPEELAAAGDDREAKRIFARQRMELKAQRERQANEEEVLRKEIASLKEAIGGFQAQVKGVAERLSLFTEELKVKKALLDRQLTRKTEVLALQRAEAGLAGEQGELTARIADSKERIARAQKQIAEIRSAAVQKALQELRETEAELDDVGQQMHTGRDVLDRVDVRAPVRGVVVKLNYHTRGAVVAPGSVILELLPLNEALIIEARVTPNEISHVHERDEALVRLTGMNRRRTPVIDGRVTYVSADKVAERQAESVEPLTGQRFSFIVRIALDERDLRQKVGTFQPVPGMPADVYIKTGQRTFLEYLLQPLLDTFSDSFREP